MVIRICLPFYQGLSEGTRLGVEECLTCKDILWQVKWVQSSRITTARNRLVNDGRSAHVRQHAAEGPDFFLFVDSDIHFHAGDVLALLSQKKDVITGAYPTQNNPEELAAGYWEGGVFGGFQVPVRHTLRGLHPVDWCGAGFLLIHRSVFFKVSYPWFHESLCQFSDGMVNMPGEDQTFTEKCRHAGITVWLDADVRLRHQARKPSSFNVQFSNQKA